MDGDGDWGTGSGQAVVEKSRSRSRVRIRSPRDGGWPQERYPFRSAPARRVAVVASPSPFAPFDLLLLFLCYCWLALCPCAGDDDLISSHPVV